MVHIGASNPFSKEKRVPSLSQTVPRLGLLIACSLNIEKQVVEDIILSYQLDFLALTESWLYVTLPCVRLYLSAGA